MFKLEYHVQLTAIQICIFFCLFDGDTCCLAYCDQVKFGQYLLIHFLKIFVYSRSVAYIRTVISIEIVVYLSIWICRVFGNHTDDIHTETINALLTPPGHHIKYFFSYRIIFPVQVRLFFGETVQIIHSCGFVIFPCRTSEAASPVVRLFSFFWIFPDIVIAVWIILIFAALHKPVMLI